MEESIKLLKKKKKGNLNRGHRNIYEEITLQSTIQPGWELKAPFLEKYTTMFVQFALGKVAPLACLIVIGKDLQLPKPLSFWRTQTAVAKLLECWCPLSWHTDADKDLSGGICPLLDHSHDGHSTRSVSWLPCNQRCAPCSLRWHAFLPQEASEDVPETFTHLTHKNTEYTFNSYIPSLSRSKLQAWPSLSETTETFWNK